MGKTMLNDIVLVMQDIYFFVKFGLVLIYIFKVYRKKSFRYFPWQTPTIHKMGRERK